MNIDASGLIDNLIANLGDWRGTTLASIRTIVRDADPDVAEDWKWMGAPVWFHDGIVCVASAFKDKVKLTFPQGVHLADPDKLFNNGLSGKQWRTIDVYKDDKINQKALKALIQNAVSYNQSMVQFTNRPHATRDNPKKKR